MSCGPTCIQEIGSHTWFNNYPIFSTGRRQSPVDIATEAVEFDPSLEGQSITVNYKPEKHLHIVNTGSSVRADIKEVSEISGGPLQGKYRLEQFHFHWGSKSDRGSEHTLNDYVYSSELHLVHWNASKYSSFSEAVDKPDGLAVLGFFIKQGYENKELKQLTDNIKQICKKDSKAKLKNKFDTRKLLPSVLSDYWTYDGSLTTPPFFESVTWIVFANPIEISENQLNQLRCMKCCSCEGKYIQDNYRTPIPLGERKLRSSFRMLSTKL